jgi:hypothetical protein
LQGIQANQQRNSCQEVTDHKPLEENEVETQSFFCRMKSSSTPVLSASSINLGFLQDSKSIHICWVKLPNYGSLTQPTVAMALG